jgi:hypothetical protein
MGRSTHGALRRRQKRDGLVILRAPNNPKDKKPIRRYRALTIADKK